MNVILTFAAAVGLSGQAAPTWTPTPQMVADIEGKVAPRLPHPLAQASRDYWPHDDHGRRTVFAQFSWLSVPGRPPAVTIHARPGGGVMDGGCGVFNVYYDVETAQVTEAMCGGR